MSLCVPAHHTPTSPQVSYVPVHHLAPISSNGRVKIIYQTSEALCFCSSCQPNSHPGHGDCSICNCRQPNYHDKSYDKCECDSYEYPPHPPITTLRCRGCNCH